MSNRFNGKNRTDHKSNSSPQMKFIPKRDSQRTTAHQTLSSSFRPNPGGGGGDDAVASTSRVRSGDNGEGLTVDAQIVSSVIYLPQDEAVAMGLGPEEGGLDPVEAQRVVDLLNRELSRLLKLRPKDFWREVATDESLSAFLESFLKFRSRWYEFPHSGAQGSVAGVIVGELELSRRIFMVLYRLSSNQDPGAKASEALNPEDHGAVLQKLKLLDLPKLLDICAIYSHENEDLTQKMVMNALKAQPHIHDDFPDLLSHFLSIVQTMNQRCNSSLECFYLVKLLELNTSNNAMHIWSQRKRPLCIITKELLTSGAYQDQGSSRLHLDYLEVMDFINDSVVSLDSFVNAYKQAAVFFSSPVLTSYGNGEMLTTLALLHDSLLPSLQKGFPVILKIVDEGNKEKSNGFLTKVFASIKLLSTRLVNFGWRLLYLCYLSDEAFESNYSLNASGKMFPANIEDPSVRVDILIQTIRDLTGNVTLVPGYGASSTFIQAIERNYKIMSRIKLLQETGWLAMEDEQLQFLSAVLLAPQQADMKASDSPSYNMASNKSQVDEDAAMVESKINQIKELFPEYGRGFIVACLEVYSQNTEEVIQRILEDTLHEELQSLDISLEEIPTRTSASTSSRRDKAKGKLEVHPVIPAEIIVSSSTKNQVALPLGSSTSSIGRFVRKNANDSPDFETLDCKKDKELAKTATLISQLEYEDEYDDSFDELGLSVGDSGIDEPDKQTEETDRQRGLSAGADNSSTSNGANSKWGSRRAPQFYVKDGKNYSYKVAGSVAVANYNEARLVNQAQKELIHGLGKGGNLPLGAVRTLTEPQYEQINGQETDEVVRPGGRGTGRSRVRRGSSAVGVKNLTADSKEEQEGHDNEQAGGRGGRGNFRGGRRGRGRDNYRKERAMNKHFSGLPGHFT